MKFLKTYNFFESTKYNSYEDLIGQLLHLYGSIPMNKTKSSKVIKYILSKYGGQYDLGANGQYELGEDVRLPDFKFSDKVRFIDYFDNLLNDEDTRGHNFEGLVCGLFNGELSTNKSSKYDLIINNKIKCSVKFTNNYGESPTIGRFKDIMTNSNLIIEGKPLIKYVEENDGLYNMFYSKNPHTKEIWDEISSGIDCWILCFPIEDKKVLQLNIVKKEQMYNLISKYPQTPRNKGDKYTLRLAGTYRDYSENYKKSLIYIPEVSVEELKKELSNDWADEVFVDKDGKNWANKMRPDVLNFIKTNKNAIITRLRDLPDETNKPL